MQWLEAVLLLGLLVALFLAAIYLAGTQKTPNRRRGSALNGLHAFGGMYNVFSAREKLDEIADEQRRRATRRK